jgi:hypothetical protein
MKSFDCLMPGVVTQYAECFTSHSLILNLPTHGEIGIARSAPNLSFTITSYTCNTIYVFETIQSLCYAYVKVR